MDATSPVGKTTTTLAMSSLVVGAFMNVAFTGDNPPHPKHVLSRLMDLKDLYPEVDFSAVIPAENHLKGYFFRVFRDHLDSDPTIVKSCVELERWLQSLKTEHPLKTHVLNIIEEGSMDPESLLRTVKLVLRQAPGLQFDVSIKTWAKWLQQGRHEFMCRFEVVHELIALLSPNAKKEVEEMVEEMLGMSGNSKSFFQPKSVFNADYDGPVEEDDDGPAPLLEDPLEDSLDEIDDVIEVAQDEELEPPLEEPIEEDSEESHENRFVDKEYLDSLKADLPDDVKIEQKSSNELVMHIGGASIRFFVMEKE